jgi:peptidoglycan hydrolase CwlO-like protein
LRLIGNFRAGARIVSSLARLVHRRAARALTARPRLAVLVLAGLCALVPAAFAGAAKIEALESKVESARAEAAAIAEELRATQAELAAARARADEADARLGRLAELLAVGEERAAELAAGVERSQRRAAEEKRRLRRARAALASRLVAIYEAGTPDDISLILGSTDFDDLTTRAGYLEQIEEFDTALADRVEEVRQAVHRELLRVSELKERADAYNARLVAARSEIASVRAEAEAAAARLGSLSAAREASLADLRGKIEAWVVDIEEAEAASRAAAEEEVERWLGGPYSIPAYIVMCESGGDYGALNPSSGAGGAYQIIPSTWDLYGGEGAPHEAPKSEQDRIAAEIWGDSGGSAWVCAG